MLNELANGRESSLLDLGCGPGALRSLLSPNIKYHGIDIALQEPASFMRELDFAQNPISFDGQRFDFIVALGLLEYMGTLQHGKFEEISDVLNPDGKFIMSYVNFGHLRRKIWPNYNNVQSIEEMAKSLNKVFNIERCFPASHHWRPKQPGRYALRKIQMHINFSIPLLSPWLALEYFFVCSHK
jgi:SAM-dependent methyltransferase